MHNTSNKAQAVVNDVAYNAAAIQTRLSGIPVFTVANKDKNMVVVTGEVREAKYLQIALTITIISAERYQPGPLFLLRSLCKAHA